MADENNVKVTTAILAIQEAREEGRAQGFAEGERRGFGKGKRAAMKVIKSAGMSGDQKICLLRAIDALNQPHPTPTGEKP